jgi:hypothetical protein
MKKRKGSLSIKIGWIPPVIFLYFLYNIFTLNFIYALITFLFFVIITYWIKGDRPQR